MPKPIAMMIEVEEVAFGKVWRTLDAMSGVVNIKIEGHGPKTNGAVNGKQRGGKPKSTAAEIILNLLREKSPIDRAELLAALTRAGKAATTLPDTLTKLKKEKLIAGIGKGSKQFKLTPTGQKALAQLGG